jgi:hypothetical protein
MEQLPEPPVPTPLVPSALSSSPSSLRLKPPKYRDGSSPDKPRKEETLNEPFFELFATTNTEIAGRGRAKSESGSMLRDDCLGRGELLEVL